MQPYGKSTRCGCSARIRDEEGHRDHGPDALGAATRPEPEWPDKPQGHANTPWPLFEPSPVLQKLVVLADADLLAAPDDAGMTRAALLTGLLTHPYIEMLRYRDEGLAAEQPGDREPPKGWACLLPPDGEQWRTLIYAHGSERRTYTGVSTEVAAYARDDTGSGAYRPPARRCS